MRTISKLLEIIENRVRDLAKMKSASEDIDSLRRKAPAGWDSARIIRHTREARS